MKDKGKEKVQEETGPSIQEVTTQDVMKKLKQDLKKRLESAEVSMSDNPLEGVICGLLQKLKS